MDGYQRRLVALRCCLYLLQLTWMSQIGASQRIPQTFFISENFKREHIVTELSQLRGQSTSQASYSITSISYITNNMPVTYEPASGRLVPCGQFLHYNDERGYFCVTETAGQLMTTSLFAASVGENFDLVITIDGSNGEESVIIDARVSIMKRCFHTDEKFRGILTQGCFPASQSMSLLGIEDSTTRFEIPGNRSTLHIISDITMNGNGLFSTDGMDIQLQLLGASASGDKIDTLKQISFLSAQRSMTKSLNSIVRLGNTEMHVTLEGTQGGITNSGNDIELFSFRGDIFCGQGTCLHLIQKWREALLSEVGCVDTTEKTNILSYFDLCQAPPQVQIPSPTPITVQLWKPASLLCDLLSPRPPLIRWLKTRHGLTTEISKARNLDFSSVSLDDQATYRCSVWNGITVKYSNDVEIRINDSIMVSFSMKIKNRNFNNNLLDHSSSDFTALDSQIRHSVLDLLFSLATDRETVYSTSLFRHSPPDFYYDGVVEMQLLPADSASQLTADLYARLQPSLAAQALGTLQVTNASFEGSAACFPESSILSNGLSIVRWPVSAANEVASVACPATETDVAKRDCSLDSSTRLARWDTFNNTQCTIVDPVSKGLDEIQQTNVTKESVSEISESVSTVTSNSTLLTSKDVTETLDILEKITRTLTTDDKVQYEVTKTIDNILEADKAEVVILRRQSNFTKRFLDVLDKLGILSAFNETDGFTAHYPNIALASIEVVEPEPNGMSVIYDQTTGLQIESGANSTGSNTSLSFFYFPSDLFETASEAEPVQVFVLFFPNTSLFLPTTDSSKTLSPTFTAAVFVNDMEVTRLSSPLEYYAAPQPNVITQTQSCVWYNEEASRWSGSGCKLVNSSISDMTVCQCDHFTSFAILFGADSSSLSDTDEDILTAITYVGCGISLAGAFLTFLTFLVFPHLRNTRPPKILMNLCAALIGMIIFFVVGVESTGNQTGCKVVAIFLQYFFLSVFTWSFVEAVVSFQGIVRPMAVKMRREMLFGFVFAWGVPLILTAIGAGVWWDDYSDAKRCVVHDTPFYITVLPPIALIMIFNTFALVMILCAVKQSSDRYSHATLTFRVRIRIVFAFLFLFGLTWIFGFLVVNNDIVAFQYVFCILNSLHGLYIFIFYCARSDAVRLAWKEHAFFNPAKFRSAQFASTTMRGRKQTQSTLQISPQQHQQLQEQHERYQRHLSSL